MATTMQQQSIAILHTQTLLRGSLTHVLADGGLYRILADVVDPGALKRTCALGTMPDLVILCLANATADSCAILHWITTRLPHCRLLVLDTMAPLPQVLQTVRAGAHGYLPPEDGLDVLCRVLRVLLENGLYYPPALWAHLRCQFAVAQKELKRPSPTKCAFLVQVAAEDNPTYLVIAVRMDKKPRLIDKYRDELFAEYHIQGKSGLVLLAVRLGLV